MRVKKLTAPCHQILYCKRSYFPSSISSQRSLPKLFGQSVWWRDILSCPPHFDLFRLKQSEWTRKQQKHCIEILVFMIIVWALYFFIHIFGSFFFISRGVDHAHLDRNLRYITLDKASERRYGSWIYHGWLRDIDWGHGQEGKGGHRLS